MTHINSSEFNQAKLKHQVKLNEIEKLLNLKTKSDWKLIGCRLYNTNDNISTRIIFDTTFTSLNDFLSYVVKSNINLDIMKVEKFYVKSKNFSGTSDVIINV